MAEVVDYEKYILWDVVIGSHLWMMDREDSDIDRFVVFAYPTHILLRGYSPRTSFFVQRDGMDFHYHEIGAVVNQLLKGNINFIIGTLSHLVYITTPMHKKFAEFVGNHPCKNVYHSIRGMAVHNYSKYILSGKDTSENRCNKILRVLQFGITLLRTGIYEFKPFSGGTPELVKEKIDELDEAYRESKLPERMPEAELRDLLFETRLKYF